MDAVLSSMNTAALFPLSFPVLFNSDIALSPAGVAAFPSPKRFAAVFSEMSFIALPSSRSLKSNESGSESSFVSILVMPHFSAIRIIPPHRAMLPASVIQRETASPQPFSAACESLSILPVNTEKNTAEAVKSNIKYSSIFDKPHVLIKYVTIKDKSEILRKTVDK